MILILSHFCEVDKACLSHTWVKILDLIVLIDDFGDTLAYGLAHKHSFDFLKGTAFWMVDKVGLELGKLQFTSQLKGLRLLITRFFQLIGENAKLCTGSVMELDLPGLSAD